MPRPRVLIIDDDLDVAQVLRDHLTEEGLRVSMSHHAEDGYTAAIQDPPQLVLLDVNLPGATGFQICDRLRKNPSTSQVPIIMMSGAARWANQQQIGRNLGANDYILKPFQIADVSAKIHSMLGTTPMPPEPEPPAPIPPAVPEVAPPAPQIEDLADVMMANVAEPMPPVITATPEPAVVPMQSVTQPLEVKENVWQPIPFTEPVPVAPVPVAPSVVPSAPAMKSATPSIESTRMPKLFWILMGIHAAVSTATLFRDGMPMTNDMLHVALQTAAGWILMVGLLCSVAAGLGIALLPRMAIFMAGLAGIPIVLRAFLQLLALRIGALEKLGSALGGARVDLSVAVTRPFDLFEMASAIILGLLLRRHSGVSVTQAFLAVGLVALAWVFAGRGFFLLR